MSLPTVQDTNGIPGKWDWKASFIERMADGSNMDLFTENSLTPDTMLLFAGPPRRANEMFTEYLSPLGLITNWSYSVDNQLQPHWEIGTDMTYFTRGKAIHSLQIGAMVANKPSLMKLLSRASPTGLEETEEGRSVFPEDNKGQFWLNLDSETLSKPFGMLCLFKTKGGVKEDSKEGAGTPIGSVYFENCNIGSFTTGASNQDIVIQENVTIMFDRVVAVDYN